MNKYFTVVVSFVLLFSFDNCQNRQKTDSQEGDSTTVTSSVTETAIDVVTTGRLADLGLTTSSHWRGINLGDDFGKVKATEKGEAFESDATHSGYTIEFKNLESADMLYYQANQKVSAIDVDLFLNSRQSVTDYQKDLAPYFSARYGASKPGNGGTVWTGPKGETITLKDVSKGKDFGLKIKILPAGGVITASAR
ncbi:hypothetical protein [Spirosoma endbachense]|uniref:Uncharacterized protein n=1 Tax=Spirosoma endbachense TaxID=2666025 RepID=A0A6P1W7G8_9BACT|nr:hypothetical protein [Spirosoma endbachense]QHV99850.1 hypothetical protein GJR95_34705 [Spirosoma endbachense]